MITLQNYTCMHDYYVTLSHLARLTNSNQEGLVLADRSLKRPILVLRIVYLVRQ